MGYKIITLAELTKMLEKYNHKELHVHHTWRPNHAQYYGTSHTSEDQRALDRQKAFYDYHTKTNGWIDIAQHVTLLPDGRFVTGRDFSVNPASIAGYNSGAFAVEMIGDFDIGRDKFEGTQKESMIGLARWFDGRGKYIRFHRENSSKTCPGSGISKVEFMEEVRGKTTTIDKEGDNMANRTLRNGSRGDDVKELQEFLEDHGYSPGTVDGIFGSKTQTAVKNFQKKYGLTADGIVGTKTFAKIDEITNKEVNSAKSTVKAGDRVKIIGNKYVTGTNIPDWVRNQVHTVSSVNGDKTQALLGANGGINSWVYMKDLQVVSTASTPVKSNDTTDYKARLDKAKALAKQILEV